MSGRLARSRTPCVRCGNVTASGAEQGLCFRCWLDQRQQASVPIPPRGRARTSCPTCGSTDSPPFRDGRCKSCRDADGSKRNVRPDSMPTRWAKAWDACQSCGTTTIPHMSKGLCRTCYERARQAALKQQRPAIDRPRGALTAILTAEWLNEQYGTRQRSLEDIAQEVGCSRSNVLHTLRRKEVPIRSGSQARGAAAQAGKVKRATYDPEFFAHWSAEMAWVLGVIYTDGNLGSDDERTGPCLSVAQAQPELLEKVLALMKSDATVSRREQSIPRSTRTTTIYNFRISRRELHAQLVALGVTPNKSLTLRWPAVPAPYVRDFIRGCWDGDGSVSRSGGKPVASYVTGSRQFIDGMVEALDSLGLPHRTVRVRRPEGIGRHLSYTIGFTGRDQCAALAQVLYEGVPPTAYLERKYCVFTRGAHGLVDVSPPVDSRFENERIRPFLLKEVQAARQLVHVCRYVFQVGVTGRYLSADQRSGFDCHDREMIRYLRPAERFLLSGNQPSALFGGTPGVRRAELAHYYLKRLRAVTDQFVTASGEILADLQTRKRLPVALRVSYDLLNTQIREMHRVHDAALAEQVRPPDST